MWVFMNRLLLTNYLLSTGLRSARVEWVRNCATGARAHAHAAATHGTKQRVGVARGAFAFTTLKQVEVMENSHMSSHNCSGYV